MCEGSINRQLSIVEILECRRLLAGYPLIVQALPFSLDFSSDQGRLLDKDGQGTGFTWVQSNGTGSEYQSKLIDLDTSVGVLKITSTGNSSAGSNYGADNSLVNGLQVQFNGTVNGGFTISTRLVGPLSNL